MKIEEWTGDDPRRAAWDALRERVGYATPPEPLPAGARCLLLLQDDDALARCSLGTAIGMAGAPGRSGWIGHYEALDAAAGAALLRHARARLAAEGARRVVGPLNGSTWARYRIALPSDDAEPPFWGEPCNPPEYAGHFRSAGFAAVAQYGSRVVTDLSRSAEAADAAEARLRARGIGVRALRPEAWDGEMAMVHALSLAAFRENRFYTPLALPAFAAMYAPMRDRVDPALVRLAHDAAGRLVGFVFAYPDPLDAARGTTPRVVLKTLATAPEARGMGIGAALTARVHAAAAERGAPAVIHALMEADNASVRISEANRARPFRRYALFGWAPPSTGEGA